MLENTGYSHSRQKQASPRPTRQGSRHNGLDSAKRVDRGKDVILRWCVRYSAWMRCHRQLPVRVRRFGPIFNAAHHSLHERDSARVARTWPTASNRLSTRAVATEGRKSQQDARAAMPKQGHVSPGGRARQPSMWGLPHLGQKCLN